ncbi:hypothetical protein [Candidatus Fukatsuia endosymbiont of Tuberolachnus salignus]|uniref:hypothetical protein n=1 Tax=Candidatus Fukatsuia endosymbiont of Tuberolachnus salignus TaxID=3077957 RepID=UPI00313DF860
MTTLYRPLLITLEKNIEFMDNLGSHEVHCALCRVGAEVAQFVTYPFKKIVDCTGALLTVFLYNLLPQHLALPARLVHHDLLPLTGADMA